MMTLEVYLDQKVQSNCSEEISQRVENGEYPIIFANSGKFEHMFVSAEELGNFEHWDALDEDVERLAAEHGFAPILYNGIPDSVGMQHKVLDHTSETNDEETIEVPE